MLWAANCISDIYRNSFAFSKDIGFSIKNRNQQIPGQYGIFALF
jgi:hypothetical protein